VTVVQVVIAGAHGQIALRLSRILSARGDTVRGLIRNPDHGADIEAAGGEPVVCDLERSSAEEIAPLLDGAGAAVFAAGAGPGSGASRKLSVDRDGAIKLLSAATTAGVARYVIVSSVGAERPPTGDDVFAVYLRAKAAADAAVAASDRQWTIVRPGALGDDPGTGRVRIGVDPFRAAVARDDVAAVLDAVLHEPRSAGLTLYVGGGEDPVDVALAALLA
jgi:nucleoside-diphosphate-sugar epimerase